MKSPLTAVLCRCLFPLWFATSVLAAESSSPPAHRLLYVATPGVRDELDHGGHGILVFDIDAQHQFVRRIRSGGVDETNHVMNVKGICADAAAQRLYVSTLRTLMCFDLATDRMLWEKAYDGGCDRMSIAPAARVIFLPSFEKDHWHVIDSFSGEILRKIAFTNVGAHNTIVGPDGRFAYLAGLKSPVLHVVEVKSREVVRDIGPFSKSVRPFTINGAQTLVYANVNALLGFEIADLKTGKLLHRVEVQGAKAGPVKRHGCPSHGIALTRDEKEVWISDAANRRVHIFDNTVMPPRQVASVELRDEPGWITLSLDGRFAYPSTGDVIDVKTRRIVAHLTDETGAAVQSEKLLEIDFAGDRPVRAGDQFAIGGVH